MRKKTFLGISVLATLACAGTAHADDGGWQLHGFGDISLKSDYVTPRGLVVVDDGATIQVLNGLVAVAPSGIAFHAGTWVDLNPGFNRKENITAVNEFDWFVGVSGPIAKGLTAGVEYSEFISGQPSVAFQPERNIEFSLKYADNPDKSFSVNPYAKFFWAVDSKSSTTVLGKRGKTFDIELGAVPTIKVGGGTIAAPTWITVGPKTYWGAKDNPLAVEGQNFGVFSTGLKGSTPLKFFTGGAKASIYAQVQYYHLINDNLVTARRLLTNSTGRNKVIFATGINVGF